MSKSSQLSQRSCAAVWHPCTQMHSTQRVAPLAIVKAKGAWLHDDQGRVYVDLISSWWVNLLGHADAGISQAIVDQLQKLPHVLLAGCTHEPAVTLAERLSALTQGVLGHCFYASDGASAVEIAMKMSAHHWYNQGQTEKSEFVCLQGGYHGETLGALSVTDVPIFRQAYAAMLRPVHMAPSPDARLAESGETAIDTAQRAAAALELILQQHAPRIAALVLEPMIQCAGGMAMYDAEYLRLARALCRRYDVHVIADEIAVGCGRTGHFFAWQHSAQTSGEIDWPDFVCLSKGITGGFLPLSVVLTRDSIYQSFWHQDVSKGFLHSHSYTGNPLACAAALAVLDRLQSSAASALLREQALYVEQIMADMVNLPELSHCIRHLRQLGTVAALDFDPSAVPAQFAEILHLAAREHGLLLRPIGYTLYIMPPLVLTPDLVGFVQNALRKTLIDVLSQEKAGEEFSNKSTHTC